MALNLNNERQRNAVKSLLKKSRLAAEIFLFLCEQMKGKSLIICSNKALEKEFNKTRMTIFRAITVIKNEKMLTVLKTSNMNIYCLDSKIIDKEYKDRTKNLCEFDGAILLAKSENDFSGTDSKQLSFPIC